MLSGQQAVSKDEIIESVNDKGVIATWLASGYYNESNDRFIVRYCQADTTSVKELRFYDGTFNIIYMYEMGVVPTITLRNDLEVYGDGNEDSPYIFVEK